MADIRALWEAAPQVRVFNRYGPTETTIAVTHVKLTPEMLAGGRCPSDGPTPGSPSTSSTAPAGWSTGPIGPVSCISAGPN